jgi:hypothetical protein
MELCALKLEGLNAAIVMRAGHGGTQAPPMAKLGFAALRLPAQPRRGIGGELMRSTGAGRENSFPGFPLVTLPLPNNAH